jgi:hypothetical protein
MKACSLFIAVATSWHTIEEKRIKLPKIKRQNNLPVVLNKQEVRDLQIKIMKK